MDKLKVALVHDYLVSFGGAERVLIALHEIWPEAPVFVSIADPKKMGSFWSYFKDWQIKTSWFQGVPGASRLISPLRFLLPLIWESFDFTGFDIVISSSSWAISKAVLVKPGAVHFCYCHTPPRFLYSYPQAQKWLKYWPVKIYSALINHKLRIYDYLTSQKVDYFIANSEEVRRRIKKFYRRDSIVIQPPIVDLKPLSKKTKRKDFYFYASRLYSYKHPEIAIEACVKMGRKLIIAGDGALRPEVEKAAADNSNITYLGRVSDQELWRLYRQCGAFLYPVESEDFGMMPLEAAHFGAPTIAYYSAGTKETVLEGKTGLFFKEPTADSLVEAIRKSEQLKFSAAECRNWAANFSKENFKKRINQFVASKLNGIKN